jgi:AcrR family transcriptional regulator
MEAAIACVERTGMRGFSLEDVAAEAGMSRTSIYRYFPGGRTQLVEQTATWEIARFWGRLADAVAELPTLEDRLVAGLVIGRKVMQKSRILTNLLDSDFRELVAAVQPAEPLIHGVIRDYMREMLEQELAAGRLREGTDLALGADYLTRMTLSWLGSPVGVDVTDEATARRVVRQQFLAGLVPPSDPAPRTV